MPPILTDEQREHAAATANMVAAAMARLDREHGEGAVMEALRLIISALPSDERRQAIIAALMRGKPPV